MRRKAGCGGPAQSTMKKSPVFRAFLLILGCLCCSIATNWIMIPNGLAAPGITGISMTIEHFTGINYALIYGNWGASELGIAGAAWGTNLSALVGCAVYACFFFIPRSFCSFSFNDGCQLWAQ